MDEVIYSNGDGELWCAFGSAEEAAIPRTWNGYGVFRDAPGAQIITVEINIPTTSNSATVAGFFGSDPVSGAVYLMHDGGIGGGKKGVGAAAFLAWSKSKLVEVERSEGPPRFGIIIGKVDDEDLASRIWRFVTLVRSFKDAVSRGDLDSETVRRAITEWEDFKSESSGHRRGKRSTNIDYVSYHGDVVQLLYDERHSRREQHESVSNSPLVDLLVRSGGAMIEIYEVKTSLDRQSLYTAIGQLLAHSVGAAANVLRTLVVPEGEMPPGIENCLTSLGIGVRRFNLTPGPSRTAILL